MSARPEDKRDRRVAFLISVYLLALLVRLIPVLLSRDLGIGLDDMFQYDMLARSLAAGNGFRWYAPPDLRALVTALEHYTALDISHLTLPDDPRGMLTTFRAPLYPVFLSIAYRLSGMEGRFFGARLAQAIIMALLAPITYLLSRELGAREHYARLSAYVPAFWPLLVLLPLGLATENLFLPLLAGGTLCLLHTLKTGRDRGYLVTGSLLGLATITRSVIVGFPLLTVVWLWLRRQRRGAILLLLALLLLTVPWSVRNTLLEGRPTFIETSLGYNLYLGYHPEGDGSFIFGPSLDLITILDDGERNAVGQHLAWGFIRRDPGRVPWLMIRKLGHLWGLEDRAFVYFYSNGLLGALPLWALAAVFLIITLPLVLLLPWSIFGWLVDAGRRNWWVPSILLAWYIGVHVLIMAEERFHLALIPMLAALAARGLDRFPLIRDGLRAGHRRARLVIGATVLLVSLAMANWGLELARNAGRLAILFGPGGSSAHFNY
jgi:hypothetical protein